MCCSKGLLKRFIPFFLTFAAGLLIASFFVPILPNLSFRSGRKKHREQDWQREVEVQRLLDENYNLKLQLEEIRKNQMEDNWDGRVGVLPLLHEVPAEPPPPPMPPRAPVAPKKAR
jgi:hypothetical protein